MKNIALLRLALDIKRVKMAGAWVVVTIAIGTVSATASYAEAPTWWVKLPPLASFSTPASTTPAAASPLLTNETTVLTRQGISPARASQALSLQREIAETHLAGRIEAALVGAYAGVWLEPTAAKFHIGVTSNASRQAAKRVVAQAGLTTDVVETDVRSTWGRAYRRSEPVEQKAREASGKCGGHDGHRLPRNAVSITLSSSIPSAERAVLEDEAATAGVNVSINAVSPSQLRLERKAKKTCKAPFAPGKAYCEETITSGVGIGQGKPECTAGPMLIEGNETYLLTAGHCFGKKSPKTGSPIEVVVTSEYPTGGGQKEIGKEGTWYENTERDIAEIKVKRPGLFTEPLPNPVPALMAEWVKEPKTPHAVGGVQAAEVAIPGQAVCHEGEASGENCGEVKALNKTLEGTEHLVEVTACSDHGDSGGPYFFLTETVEVLMMGTEVGGPIPDCSEKGPYKSYFEPLLDLPEAKGFGILSTFKGQKLLTTSDEVRPCGG